MVLRSACAPAPALLSEGKAEGDAENVGEPVSYGNIATGGEALALFVKGTEEGAGHSENSGGAGKATEEESEDGING